MSRKRPTESSWDSDEDLLGDDISGINAFRDEDIDEDALLGESDEEMDAGGAGETIAENIDETEETAEDSFITAGDQSQNEPDEEVLDVIVDEDEDEILGISTSEFDDSTYSQYSETAQQRPISSRSSQVQDEPVREPEPLADQNFTQDDPGEDSITLGQDDTADDTEDAPEERPEEEEEEDEESEDEEKHERGRFTSERRNTISLKMKRERDSIPDTLELSAEELAKIEEIQNKIGHQHNYRGGRGNRRGRGRYNNRQHPNQGNHQGMFNMRPGMGPRPNFPGPNRGMHPGQFNPPYPILQQQQQHHQQQQQHQQQQMRPNMPQGMPQHQQQQQQQQQQGPPMHQGPNNNSPMPAGPSPTPQRPKIHINPHFRGNRPQQTQSAGYTAPQTVPAQTVQSLMTPRPAVGPLLPQPQQGQMPPTSMNMNNMQQRPPHNQPFQQQRPAFSWSGTPQQQQQPPQQSQAGFMVGSGPRPPYPQQPFAQPPQQQQQHGMGPQQQIRPQGPMNMQPQQAGSPIMRPPLNQQGARFNFNPNPNQGPQKFNQGGPGFNDQWNRGPQQPPQQQGPPHSQYQGGPLMGQQPMQRPPQQQQPPHQQQQFQPQRPQFDPQHQNQQRFPGPPHSQQQQQFRPQGGGGGNFQPRTSPGQQPRFNQPQQTFNSPPRPLQPQGPRQQTPHHMGSQVRPLFQQHGQPQQFGGPHNNRMDTQEEAQPIQTLVSGVNTNTPRRNVKPVPMQPKPLQQRNAQLTDEQKKLLLRKQRFEAAASPAKTAGKISLSSAAKTSQKKLLAAKQFQATKQLQAAAQKRRSVEPPSASPPKQARIMLRRPIQGPDGNPTPVLSSPVKKMVPVSMPAAPAPTPPKPTNTAESMLDADLAAKLENQRKLRERIQRQKELNRQNQAAKKRATLIQTLAEQGLTLDDITDGQSEEMEATPTPVPVQQSPKPMTPTSPQFKVPQGPGFMGPNPTGAKATAPAPRGKKAVPMTLTQIRNLQSQGKKVTIQGQGRGQGVRGRGRGRGQTQNMMGRGQPVQGQGQMGNQGGIPANQQQGAAMRGQGQNQRKLRGRGMANRGGAAVGRGGQNLTQQGQAPPNQGNNFNPTQNFEPKRGRGVMRGIMQGPARGGMNRQNLGNTMGPGANMGQVGSVGPGAQHPQHQQQQQQQMHHPIQPHNNGQPPKQHQPPSNRTVLAQGIPGQGQVQNMPQGQGQGQGAGNKRRIVLGGGDMVTNTVLIQNLSRSTPRGQVEQMCMQVGQPLTMNVNQQGCFVQFSSPDQAVQFRNRFNRHMIDLSHITVSLVPQS